MTIFFDFESLLRTFERKEPYDVTLKGKKDEYSQNGKVIKYPDSTVKVKGALVPISANTLRRYDNGVYTSKDKTFYCRQDLPEGSVISDGKSEYRIAQDNDYSQWTNVRIYNCSALERGQK